MKTELFVNVVHRATEGELEASSSEAEFLVSRRRMFHDGSDNAAPRVANSNEIYKENMACAVRIDW